MASARLTISAYRLRESVPRESAGPSTISVIDTQMRTALPLTNVALSSPGAYAIEVLFEPLDTEMPTRNTSGAQGFTAEMVAQIRRAAKDTLSTDLTKKRFHELDAIANLMERV